MHGDGGGGGGGGSHGGGGHGGGYGGGHHGGGFSGHHGAHHGGTAGSGHRQPDQDQPGYIAGAGLYGEPGSLGQHRRSGPSSAISLVAGVGVLLVFIVVLISILSHS